MVVLVVCMTIADRVKQRGRDFITLPIPLAVQSRTIQPPLVGS
jgi:hypothetical protein